MLSLLCPPSPSCWRRRTCRCLYCCCCVSFRMLSHGQNDLTNVLASSPVLSHESWSDATRPHPAKQPLPEPYALRTLKAGTKHHQYLTGHATAPYRLYPVPSNTVHKCTVLLVLPDIPHNSAHSTRGQTIAVHRLLSFSYLGAQRTPPEPIIPRRRNHPFACSGLLIRGRKATNMTTSHQRYPNIRQLPRHVTPVVPSSTRGAPRRRTQQCDIVPSEC